MNKTIASKKVLPKRQIDQNLIAEYKGFVKRIAYHLMGRLPPGVLIEDLIQVGLIGLIEAAKNYDSNHGATFETYAGIRIRGAMLDEVRRTQWSSRSLHQRVRKISKAIHTVEAKTGRVAKASEIAKCAKMSLDAYHQVLQEAKNCQILSLGKITEDNHRPTDSLASKALLPEEHLSRENMKALIAKIIGDLPEREKLIMSLYYELELNLREIGKVLGVSESRVCQIHSQTLLRIRARLAYLYD